MSEELFTWIPAYEAIANALLARKYNRGEVLSVFAEITGDDERANIDPFTFFTAFNRSMIEVDRKSAIETVMQRFDIDAPLPRDFVGIPCSNQEDWQYFDDSDQGIDDCWMLFETALELADEPEALEETHDRFCELFDTVHKQDGITKARLTRTLYWMRPNAFLPFGEKSREYLHAQYGINTPIMMRGARYLRLLKEVNAVCDEPFHEIAARSYKAADDSAWWPYAIDYDPDMSIHQWITILNDDEITTPEILKVLKFMHEEDDETTPEELAEHFLHDREYYSSLLRGYARNVARKMGRGNFKGSWWPIMFVGRNANDADNRKGDYIWRMRPELIEALVSHDKIEI